MDVVAGPHCSTHFQPTHENICQSCRNPIPPSSDSVVVSKMAIETPQMSVTRFQYQSNLQAARNCRMAAVAYLILAAFTLFLSSLVSHALVSGVFPDWSLTHRTLSSVLLSFLFSAVVASRVLGQACLQSTRAKRLSSPNAIVVLNQNRQAPILYLRSFRDDGLAPEPSAAWQLWFPLNYFFRPSSYEENVINQIAHLNLGPVVAIGRPGEDLPTLGACRLYVGEQDWQAQITELMKIAGCVIVRPSVTAGLMWEFQQAIAVVPPERIIIDLEPTSRTPR